MNNLKEMIKKFDYIKLEVVDAWQLPAIYLVYKNNTDLDEINSNYFIKKLDEQEYFEFIEKIEKLKLEEWLYDYLPDKNEKIEEEYTWKIIVCSEGKKVVKKGKNKSPKNFSELENLMIELTSLE